MPVYRISKEHRAKLLNVTPQVHDAAERLRLAAAQRSEYMSWHDALRTVDPTVTCHPEIPTNITDNGHHNHGEFHTITVSSHMAALLQERLGVTLTFHHALHHVMPLESSS
jgi:hypothetical protein